MAGLPAPAGDERQTLINFLAFQQNAFAAVAHGLTDEQARSTPSVSALSVGALIKHVTAVQAGWVARVAAAPDFPPRDTRPLAEQMAEHEDQLTMRDDEKLGDLLAALRAQNARTLQAFTELDLDTLVPVPHEVPWFPADVDHWSVRWVGMHIIEELSRHAGHADIIRESIDRATMYELLAAEEEWPETDFIKRWRPAVG
jgi:hypothetical protein